MTTFTGKTIANTYKDLLQISNNNAGIDTTLRNISDGEGTSSPLQLSNDTINLTGTIKLQGTTLTANVSALNNMADITGATGLIAVNSGTAYGRTIVVTEPLSIGNANGTAGNPTIGLATTGITSATYGPLGKFNIDGYGRVISVSVATTVSANSFIGGVFDGSSLTIENNTTIGNDLIVKGSTNMKAVSATDITFNNGTATTKITSPIVTATTINTTNLNVAVASITDLTAANLTFTAASIAELNATNFFAVSANATRLFKNGADVATSATVAALSTTMATSIGNRTSAITALSATMATSIANRTTAIATNVAAITSINTVVTNLSATMATSIANRTAAITSINAIIGDGGNYATSAELHAVSVLTKTNLNAITSINTVVGNLSATMATSIANRTTAIATNTAAITSINTFVTNLSATMATSIANRTAAITSINTVVGNLSATMATSINNRTTAIATNTAAITSINTVVGNLSATMATSINNRTTAIATNTAAITSINTVVAAVSVLTKTNLDAVTSINTVVTNLSATMATSISNVNGAAVAFAIALG
tara:strand:- start:1290 stop:2936 length:1647 start_codon:yes stop_codon:yes gene_type:complete